MNFATIIAGLLLAQANTSIAPRTSNWATDLTRSAIDDSEGAVARSGARDTYTNRYGKTARAEMQVVCERNTTLLGIVLPELYTSDNSNLGRVTFRVDRQKAFVKDLRSANDNGSLALTRGEAIAAIKQMEDGETLLVQFITVSEPPMTARFSLRGFKAALAPVRKACGW